jgi:hypothetical protein
MTTDEAIREIDDAPIDDSEELIPQKRGRTSRPPSPA